MIRGRAHYIELKKERQRFYRRHMLRHSPCTLPKNVRRYSGMTQRSFLK
jgi:hypothetical protein